MKTLKTIKSSAKTIQTVAEQSYPLIESIVQQIHDEFTEIKIYNYKKTITVPTSAIKVLGDFLKEKATKNNIEKTSLLSTQQAAQILGCSRPHLVKILEAGNIAFTKVGKHRRIMLKDIEEYHLKMKVEQKKRIVHIMQSDQEAGLYELE